MRSGVVDEKDVAPPSVVSTTDEIKRERVKQTVNLSRQLWTWTACVIVFMLFSVWMYSSSSGLRNLERKMTWGLQFDLRDKFGRAPQVDPRLRILMYDDSTIQAFKRSGINFKEWAALLSFVDRHRPASIYIDKIFSLLDDEPSVVQESLQTMLTLRSPVTIGAFTSSSQIPGRESLQMQTSHFRARNYLSEFKADGSDTELAQLLRDSGLKDRSKAFVYGPIPQLQEIFHQGHIDYPIPNQVFPLYSVGNNQVLPSLALSGRINFKIENGGFSAGGQPIPLTSEQTLLVNWLSPAKVYGNASTFASAFTAMRSGKLWDKIPEGAHVLILPSAYTGNTDFKVSPYGSQPGGIVLASVINSVLTKQWLADFSQTTLALVSLVSIAGLIQLLNGFRGWLVLLAGTLAIIAVGLHQFIYKSVDMPWLAGVVFFSGTGVLLLSFRSFWDSHREKLLMRFEEDYERLELEEKRLQKEIKDAARVAAALTPEEVPQWPGFEITGFHRSLSEASGDWYFFERSTSGRFAHFVLCDISGHGVQAALVVSGCKQFYLC